MNLSTILLSKEIVTCILLTDNSPLALIPEYRWNGEKNEECYWRSV